MTQAKFGMIGLGVMGRNFLLNVAEHGFSGIGYDLDAGKRKLLLEEGASYDVFAAESLTEFVEKLELPRRIMILVPAGAVDSVIGDLMSHLESGDIVIDGGNSHFPDTDRREKWLNDSGFEFLGVGVSGGEEGARHGPSIMPGGKREVYDKVASIFEAVAAKVAGEPCVTYIGAGSAGHFVKMVHNGIEYALMQVLSETYDFMKRVLNLNYDQMSAAFDDWNNAELSSFLVEITAKVLRKPDEKTGKPLVEMILDTAGQKGTGKWTTEAAMDLGIPVPMIDSAVTMRQISALKGERVLAGAKFARVREIKDDGSVTLEKLKNALYAAFIVAYAQGLSLLQAASVEKNYGLNLSEIAKIWRGGCIIRSGLLEEIRRAYAENPSLSNLMLDSRFAEILNSRRADWRQVIEKFTDDAIPALCLSSSLHYFDALRSERLPANLIQAQRDFFGAHTYQRVDGEGTFHTEWE